MKIFKRLSTVNYFLKTLRRRCLTGFGIHLWEEMASVYPSILLFILNKNKWGIRQGRTGFFFEGHHYLKGSLAFFLAANMVGCGEENL